MKRLIGGSVAALWLLIGGTARAETLTTPLTIGRANALYMRLGGGAFTAPVSFPDGTPCTAPAIARSADTTDGISFAATYFAWGVDGVCEALIGSSVAVGSDAGYTWSSTTDPTAVSDLKLFRAAAKRLSLQGSAAGGLDLDFGVFTAQRVWQFRTDVADYFVGEATVQALTNKSYIAFSSPAATFGSVRIPNGGANGITFLTSGAADANGLSLTNADLFILGSVSATLELRSSGNITIGSAVINGGTVTTGVWNGTAIGAQYGGTGLNTSASTGVLRVNAGTWSADAGISHLAGLGANVATFLATPSGANLAAALTDETGTGVPVFSDSPAITGTATFSGYVAYGRTLGTTGFTPTASSTNLGTSPTVTLTAGSTDHHGTVVMTTGTGSPGASGTMTLTFSTTAGAYGSTTPICVANLVSNGATAWDARATLIVDASGTGTLSVNFDWDNNSVALSTTTAYRISYICEGKP